MNGSEISVPTHILFVNLTSFLLEHDKKLASLPEANIKIGLGVAQSSQS